jgi:uncharacterized peroxidase-related enzyme
MDQRTRRAPRLPTISPEEAPELFEHFEAARKRLGFVPNSLLIMARNPKLVEAFTAMSAAIWDPSGKVDLKLKRLISHVASRAAGCQYCMAHTADSAAKLGIEQDKLDAVWEYEASPLFSDAERSAIQLAVAAGCVPNAVTDEMFMELRKHWTDDQVVEIVGVISLFGFLNRWNDTFATPLEHEPLEFAHQHLASKGWNGEKHIR